MYNILLIYTFIYFYLFFYLSIRPSISYMCTCAYIPKCILVHDTEMTVKTYNSGYFYGWNGEVREIIFSLATIVYDIFFHNKHILLL
jgi:hypothetical protein